MCLRCRSRLSSRSDGGGLLESDAERLFVERALAARPQLRLDDGAATAVAEVVARLDGLPLAIELAAARLSALGLGELVSRLEHRLPLLSRGVRNAPARHQGLAATIEWSYRLLDPQAQAMFSQLSVFAGSFSLDAVEAVCGTGFPEGGAFEVLADLVAKSLITLVDTGGQVRYSLLETVREYAAQCLAETGGGEVTSDRQLQWALALAERADDSLWGYEALRWTGILDAEVDNFRVALRWGQGNGRVGLGLRLAAALAYFWSRHGYSAEGRRWLSELLAVSAPRKGPARARCLAAAAEAAFIQGDEAEALSLEAKAVTLGRKGGQGGPRLGIERSGAVPAALGPLARGTGESR